METVFRLIIQLLGKSEGNCRHCTYIWQKHHRLIVLCTKNKKTLPGSKDIETVFGLKNQLTG